MSARRSHQDGCGVTGGFSTGDRDMTTLRFALALSLAFFVLAAVPAFAETPYLVTYQGKLTDTNGDPITSSQTLTFKIYKSGQTSPLWQEVHVNVPFSPEGTFSVQLGEKDGLEKVLELGGDKELEVVVGSQSMGRQLMTSSLFALEAWTVTGPANIKFSLGAESLIIGDGSSEQREATPLEYATPPMYLSGVRPVLVKMVPRMGLGGDIETFEAGNVWITIRRHINGGGAQVVGQQVISHPGGKNVLPLSCISIIDDNTTPGNRHYSVQITVSGTPVKLTRGRLVAVEL
jgi:hypothetical protein